MPSSSIVIGVIFLTAAFTSSYCFVLHSNNYEQNSRVSPSKVNMTDGFYWIQNVKNSSLMIGALDNGFPDLPSEGPLGKKGWVTAEMHDPAENETTESMLVWFLDTLHIGQKVSLFSAGPNHNNNFALEDTVESFQLPRLWQLLDRGNNETFAFNTIVWGEVLTTCLTAYGLHEKLEYVECDESNEAQSWRFIWADHWNEKITKT